MNKKEFNVLTYIERNQNKAISSNEIACSTNLSQEEVNSIINSFVQQNAISYDSNNNVLITKDVGYELLEPYRVKRAFILAAGMGTRMRPITETIPKPLVKVRGKRIIETLLDALKDAEITDVTIVRGYLGEKFDILLEKYPYLKFIDNKDYNVTNNISSANLIKNEMKSAYVMEADLYLMNPNLIRKYEYESNYVGKYVEQTDDWRYETEGDRITNLLKGGTNCYHMYAISYVSSVDGQNIGKDIQEVYENLPGGKDRFWDDVNLSLYNEKYNFYIKECKKEDIVELDTVNELKEFDNTYINI